MKIIEIPEPRNTWILGFKAVAARFRKDKAEVEAGLKFLCTNLGKMSSAQRADALGWLTRHARDGNVEQWQIDRFLKGDNGNPPKYDDAGDPDDPNDGGDVDSPKAPKDKKGKKKVEDDEEAEEEPMDTTPDRHDPRKALRPLTATDDQVLLAEVRTGWHPTAARVAQQILACARLARGEAHPALPPRGSAARAILEAGRKARGLGPLEGN
jgi:hypothetical protein